MLGRMEKYIMKFSLSKFIKIVLMIMEYERNKNENGFRQKGKQSRRITEGGSNFAMNKLIKKHYLSFVIKHLPVANWKG
jgi:hypothetical protein